MPPAEFGFLILVDHPDSFIQRLSRQDFWAPCQPYLSAMRAFAHQR
jgi:hypothetical protein